MINVTITSIQKNYDFNNNLVNIKVIVQGVDPDNPDYLHGFPYYIEGSNLNYLQQFTEGTQEYSTALHNIIDSVAIENFNAQNAPVNTTVFEDDELNVLLNGNVTTLATTLLSLEGKKNLHKDKISRIRYTYETQGVNWTDSKGNTYLFDTSTISQSKFASARTMLIEGNRIENSVWKCFDTVAGKSIFKPLTNDEFATISNLVYNHVQKCFNAEKTCFDMIDVATTEDEVLDIDFSIQFNL